MMCSAYHPLSSGLHDALHQLDQQGYCIIPDVLTAEQVSGLRERLAQQAQGELARGVAFRDGGPTSPNQRVWNLVNKGRVFRDLMLHPVIEQLMSHLLGEDFLLSSLTANIAGTGGDPMAMHTDQGYVGFWTPRPVVANIAWLLDDFVEANGATRLAPASHLTDRGSAPPSAADSVAAEGPTGSILCFDGRIWHGTGANRTDRPRRALLSYHCRPFVRQQENFALGLDPAIRGAERPALLNRLGFQTWSGLGRVENPRPAVPLFVSPAAVGPLAADGAPIEALA